MPQERLGECLHPLTRAQITDDFSNDSDKTYYLTLSIFFRIGALSAVL
jgi:hypothetical protein